MTKKYPKGQEAGFRRQRVAHRRGLLYAVIERVRLYLKRNRVVVRSCLIFAGCILAFVLSCSWLLPDGIVRSVVHSTAAATGFILNLFRTAVHTDGSVVASPDFSMVIIFECTAIFTIVIFLAAVLAYPSNIKQKAIGMALGVVALYAIDLVRMVSLFFIGTHFSSRCFDVAHFFVWQPMMILIAIVIWVFWVEKVVRVTAT
jgi:archaeosortase B (VPXXXP-CTERM-specific)